MEPKIESQILEDITASIPGAVYQFMVRPDGSWHLNFISKGVEDLFEITQEDACRDIAAIDRCIIEEDRPSHRQSITNAVQNLLPWYHEYRIRTGSGTLKWIRTTSTPQRHPDGRTVWNGILSEITEQKRVETELRRSEERYRHLYKETPVMLHSIDQDGRIVSVSNYWLNTLGFDRDEVLGRRTSDFLTEESRRRAEEDVVPNFFRTGSCKDEPYRFVKKNGEVLDTLLSAIAERNDEGKVVRSMSVIIDVTERKRAQEEIEKLNADLAARAAELENANQELEAFNYSVSHDLRKPLAVINGYCQVILELCGHSLDSQCREYMQQIYSGTRSMNQLIDALLKFSFLMHAEQHREDIDLSRIANIVAAELALAEPGRRVTFRISSGITANGDADLLQVVLENLIGNAWKYSGKQEEAVIEFGMMENEGKPAYFVRDNGAGFNMAHADRLFKPFQRLHSREAEGHGIGLATVERIITRHGGKVWAEGEPGKGATFYFTLC